MTPEDRKIAEEIKRLNRIGKASRTGGEKWLDRMTLASFGCAIVPLLLGGLIVAAGIVAAIWIIL